MKQLKALLNKEFSFVCALPSLTWQVLFLYVPLVVMTISSFVVWHNGTISFAFDHYKRVVHPYHIQVIINSLLLATHTTVLCLLLAFPVAYFLAFKVRRFRTVFLFLLILPSWTNIIVQAYAWFFLLERGGVISQVLQFLGVVHEPVHLLHGYFATLIVMVNCYLPFMILPIFSVLEKVDSRLLEASADLGASWFESLRRIIIPLSMPGVVAGCLLVFVPSFGEFAVPVLLGGAKRLYWGGLIVEKFLVANNWSSGFAFVILGIMFLIGIVALLYGARLVMRVRETRRHRKGAQLLKDKGVAS